MNAKQSLKLVRKALEQQQTLNAMAARDIKAYNECIANMIAGGSPCEYCEDKAIGECEHPEKQPHGCDNWMLRWEVHADGQSVSDETPDQGANENPVAD